MPDMKVVISAGQTKREIIGPFAIYGKTEDLLRIAEAIQLSLEARDGFSWVEITEGAPILASKPPKPWEW